jgi:hypothetical protein
VPAWLFLVGYIALLAGACGLTLFRSWPGVLASLAVQTLGVGLVAAQISPLPVAAAKIIVGWISVALLAVTVSREKKGDAGEENFRISAFFRFSLLLFLFSSIVALLPQLGGLFQDPPVGVLSSACLLIGVGLVNIGLSEHPLRSGVNLLTVLQGFELGYLWIEQSLLVLALLAFTDLATILTLIVLQSYSQASPSGETTP